MGLVGNVGVMIRAPAGDFVNPWNYFISDVIFDGGSLSQCGLWEAHSHHAGSDNKLQSPGTHTPVTGVVPVFQHESAYMVLKYFPTILRCHTSFAMRKMVAPVPQDALALQSALFWKLLATVDPDHGASTVHMNTLEKSFKNLTRMLRRQPWVKSLWSIYNRINRGETSDSKSNMPLSAFLIDENGISSFVQPLVALVTHPRFVQFKIATLESVVQDIFGLAVFRFTQMHLKRVGRVNGRQRNSVSGERCGCSSTHWIQWQSSPKVHSGRARRRRKEDCVAA